MVGGFRACAIVPTYDNPATLEAVTQGIASHDLDVIVVDDGSGAETKAVTADLKRRKMARVHTRLHNGGKGAAVKDGLRLAAELGYTHALQVDADGQHDLGDIPRLLQAARTRPDALVLGAPRYDASAPRSRLVGRKITKFWTDLETGGPVIEDPMCGFRVYPLRDANAVRVRADRMDFDIEIAVRLAWHGTPIINVPTQVRYLPAEQGGVSHFRMFADNVLISWLHTKLYNLALWRRVREVLFGWRRRPA